MKKILSLILVMTTIVFQSLANEAMSSSSTRPVSSSTRPVGLEVHQKHNNTSPAIHRAPLRIDIEVFYDLENQTLVVMYDGECTGEVFLYLNENIVGYDSEINTSFQISNQGLYKIEIIGDTWIGVGYLQL